MICLQTDITYNSIQTAFASAYGTWNEVIANGYIGTKNVYAVVYRSSQLYRQYTDGTGESSTSTGVNDKVVAL